MNSSDERCDEEMSLLLHLLESLCYHICQNMLGGHILCVRSIMKKEISESLLLLLNIKAYKYDKPLRLCLMLVELGPPSQRE